jgi:hypothetical protein
VVSDPHSSFPKAKRELLGLLLLLPVDSNSNKPTMTCTAKRARM